MSLATSNISALNKDPKFHQDAEVQFFADNKSAMFYNTRFQADLANGSVVKLINEPIPFVEDTTGHDAITYGTANGHQETFTITEGKRVNERVFDMDGKQAAFDVKKQYVKNGLRAINRELDKLAFSKLKSNSFVQLAEVDVTSGLTTANGDLIMDAISEANSVLDSQGFQTVEAEYGRRQIALDAEVRRFVKKSSNFTLATEEGDKRITSGNIQTYDGVQINNTINLYADTTSFDTTAKGAVAVGDIRFTVDNGGAGTINAPKIGDTISNGGKTFTILNVNEVTVDVEYDIQVDRPIDTAIADDATVAILGRHTVYIPLAQGQAGAGVIQQNPQFEELRDPDYNATLVRSLPVCGDYFLPVEASRRVVHIPVKYRTIS